MMNAVWCIREISHFVKNVKADVNHSWYGVDLTQVDCAFKLIIRCMSGDVTGSKPGVRPDISHSKIDICDCRFGWCARKGIDDEVQNIRMYHLICLWADP